VLLPLKEDPIEEIELAEGADSLEELRVLLPAIDNHTISYST